MKILIADKLSKVGVDWLEKQDDVEVTVKPGLSPEELAGIIGEYDGMIIRSGVKVREKALKNTGKLRGIARAGVGVDNVDVTLATKKGIIVMNTPDGNTLSTAELTWALMLALSRKISPANASLRSGEWNRKAYQGTQLAGKTLGVIGLGRIGRAVAKRAAAMDMRVLGYDPFFAGECPDGKLEMVKDLLDLSKRSDYITVHVPKSPETMGMIGREQFNVMKPSVRLINAARGGIIDPPALLEALNQNKIAGAAIDVYLKEPPDTEAEKALIQHEKVLAVPHLGASTEEAQDQVALDAAQQLVEALRGGEVRNAVNAPGFSEAIPEPLRPYAELAPRMGAMLSAITPGGVNKIEVIYRGPISDLNVSPITTYLLTGLLSASTEQPINVINAPVMAEQYGIEVEQITSAKIREFTNLMEVKITTNQMQRSAVGTIFGHKVPRIIAIDGYHMEMRPEGHGVVILNDDRPGALGQYGMTFGKHDINIADLTFSRKKRSGLAMVGLNLDEAATKDVMDEIRALEMVEDAWYIHLPELPPDSEEED